MTDWIDAVATRSGLRELEEQRRVTREGRELLDRKRTLLAAEVLRRLADYRASRDRAEAARARAAVALARACARHGLDGVQCKATRPVDERRLEITRGAFLGVPLVAATLRADEAPPDVVPGSSPSPEARACRQAFVALLAEQASIAAEASTLRRLAREYRRTERRTRALEDIVEPELDASIGRIREQLDELDQEDAVRARLRRPGRG